MNNPWGQAASQYSQDLGQLNQIQQQGYQQAAQMPLSIYDRFVQGYAQSKMQKMQEQQQMLAQQNAERQMMLAEETLRHNRTMETQQLKDEQDRNLRQARSKAMLMFNNYNGRIPGAKELLESTLKEAGLADVPLPSVERYAGGEALPGPTMPGQPELTRQPYENELSGYGPDALEAEMARRRLEQKDIDTRGERELERMRLAAKEAADADWRKQVHNDNRDDRALARAAIAGNAPKGSIQSSGGMLWSVDPRTNTAVPVTGPDGKQLAAPAADKPMTEAQGNAFGFGTRARESDALITGIEAKPGFDPASGVQKAFSSVPVVGNYLTPETNQQYNQAKRNFISAVLRKESGAAISASEFENEDKKYFPQQGDVPSVIKQKADARKTAIAVLEIQSGRKVPGGGGKATDGFDLTWNGRTLKDNPENRAWLKKKRGEK